MHSDHSHVKIVSWYIRFELVTKVLALKIFYSSEGGLILEWSALLCIMAIDPNNRETSFNMYQHIYTDLYRPIHMHVYIHVCTIYMCYVLISKLLSSSPSDRLSLISFSLYVNIHGSDSCQSFNTLLSITVSIIISSILNMRTIWSWVVGRENPCWILELILQHNFVNAIAVCTYYWGSWFSLIYSCYIGLAFCPA